MSLQDVTPENEHSSNGLVLRRAYVCHRRLDQNFFMFDLLAHSAILLDAYTTEQIKDEIDAGMPKSAPVAQFMFERYEDRINPDTQKAQPHIGLLFWHKFELLYS